MNKNIALETSRSNFTHRKVSRTTTQMVQGMKEKKREVKYNTVKETKDSDVSMAPESNTEKLNEKMTKVELDQSIEKQVNKRNVKRKQIQRKEITLMLVYNKSTSSFGDSVSIYVESGYALGLLRRFNYSGTKIIGLKEYNLIQLEKEKLVFPDDYPKTKAYNDLVDGSARGFSGKSIKHKTNDHLFKSAKDLLLEYCRKPPAKRLNYAKINSPNPFKSNWDQFEGIGIQILFSMPTRTPERLYYICLPEIEDLPKDEIQENTNPKMFGKLKLSPKDFNHDYEQIFSEKVYVDTLNSKNDELKMFKDIDPALKTTDMDCDPKLKILNRATLEINTGVLMKRKIIGYVTSGGYSMLKGYGLGKGTIFSHNLSTGQYVLIRNPAGTSYFKAKIEKVY